MSFFVVGNLGDSVAEIADGQLVANTSGVLEEPVGTTVTALLDHVFGTTQGNVLERGAAGWTTTPQRPSPVINAHLAPYNATGNGTTDDSAAIQAAANALSPIGGTVYLPATGFA